jgi:4-nitrophenyl phosphatase
MVLTNFLFDLDGTVYRGGVAIDGAVGFINRLQKNNMQFKFITNRSDRHSEEISMQLNKLGILATPDLIVTSAMAMADVVKKRRVFVLGSDNLKSNIEGAAATITAENPDDVVIGYDGAINFDDIGMASRKILLGARFLATNPDTWINSDQGIIPENGSVLAAIKAVTNKQPIMIGKPGPAIIELALMGSQTDRSSTIIIGDNLNTDIAAAVALGLQSVLLLTGVTDEVTAKNSVVEPTWVAKDYERLENIIFP